MNVNFKLHLFNSLTLAAMNRYCSKIIIFTLYKTHELMNVNFNQDFFNALALAAMNMLLCGISGRWISALEMSYKVPKHLCWCLYVRACVYCRQVSENSTADCVATRVWLSRTLTATWSPRFTWWRLVTSASTAVRALSHQWTWRNTTMRSTSHSTST